MFCAGVANTKNSGTSINTVPVSNIHDQQLLLIEAYRES